MIPFLARRRQRAALLRETARLEREARRLRREAGSLRRWQPGAPVYVEAGGDGRLWAMRIGGHEIDAEWNAYCELRAEWRETRAAALEAEAKRLREEAKTSG